MALGCSTASAAPLVILWPGGGWAGDIPTHGASMKPRYQSTSTLGVIHGELGKYPGAICWYLGYNHLGNQEWGAYYDY